MLLVIATSVSASALLLSMVVLFDQLHVDVDWLADHATKIAMF